MLTSVQFDDECTASSPASAGKVRLTNKPSLLALQPAESDADFASVKAVIGRSHTRIRHVEVTVFEDKRATRAEKVLDAQATLGHEVCGPADLRRARGQGGSKDTRTRIEERHDVSDGLKIESKEECCPQQMPAGMDRISYYSFVHEFEAAQRAASEILHPEAELRLKNQHVDVGNISRNGILNAIANTQPEIPAAGSRPSRLILAC